MICPQCGFDMGMTHRCLRCGYEVKTLATVDEEQLKEEQEKADTIVIDPRSTILTDEYGNSVDDDEDDDWYLDPISAIFEGLMGGDPFAGIFDSLFGMGTSRRKAAHNRPQVEIPKEKEDTPKVVEVNKVEFLDDNGKPIDKDSKGQATEQKIKDKGKSKRNDK